MTDAAPPLSVLFAEVSGSARLHEKLGHEEALRAVDRCLKRMERALEAFGGRQLKSVGADELIAVFDLPDDAFQAALQMLERIADLPPVSGVQPAIRIGFAHGSVHEENGMLIGAAVKTAAHLAGLAKAGQVLTSPEARLGLSPVWQDSTGEPGVAPATGEFATMSIFKHAAAGQSTANTPLVLRYGNKEVVLDEHKPTILMGRDTESDVTIRDRRASRHHARIERRGERIVLIDHSTNGTYVTLDGQPELFLRGEECVIRGGGRICFAASASSPEADWAQFE